MKKYTTLFLLCLIALTSFAQNSSLFGIVRKNYFTLVVNPIDSTLLFQQYDSSTIRLGSLDCASGVVSNIGLNAYNETVNLTGAALNPYDNTFNFIGASDLISFDLTSGDIVNRAALNNPIASSYFDNFRFNNSDSTMYGLARRSYYDSLSMNYIGEVFLAKVNTLTGTITQISSSSLAQGYAMAGSAIDPYQMVYYFSTGSNLLGVDIYNGNLYSNVAYQLPTNTYFDNFTYSCSDSTIYGLVRQNYFTYILDSLFPGDSLAVLDSTSLRLGKVDPNTGVVTVVSPVSIMNGGYSLNAGSAIDPSTMTFYFSNGSQNIGVSLITGLITTLNAYSFTDGDYFDLMRNFGNCINATEVRLNSETTGIRNISSEKNISISPNPASNKIEVRSSGLIKKFEVYSLEGKIVLTSSNTNKDLSIDISGLPIGLYMLKAEPENGNSSFSKFIKAK